MSEEKVLVEVSARHIHLTDADVEALFGPGYKLTVKKELSQPGQFASNEKVTIKGERGEMKLSVLGPTRPETQVELSLTEARTVGVKAMIRESGDIEGTQGITIIGPAGSIEITKGVIAAKRHIHMTPADAEKYGVTNGQIVSVKIDTDGRSLTFGDTVVRVSEKYALAMHIDTDEANAAAISGSALGEIIKQGTSVSRYQLKKRRGPLFLRFVQGSLLSVNLSFCFSSLNARPYAPWKHF